MSNAARGQPTDGRACRGRQFHDTRRDGPRSVRGTSPPPPERQQWSDGRRRSDRAATPAPAAPSRHPPASSADARRARAGWRAINRTVPVRRAARPETCPAPVRVTRHRASADASRARGADTGARTSRGRRWPAASVRARGLPPSPAALDRAVRRRGGSVRRAAESRTPESSGAPVRSASVASAEVVAAGRPKKSTGTASAPWMC